MLSKEYNIKISGNKVHFIIVAQLLSRFLRKKMILFEAIITICILARANSCKSTTKTVVTAQNSGKHTFNHISCSFRSLAFIMYLTIRNNAYIFTFSSRSTL